MPHWGTFEICIHNDTGHIAYGVTSTHTHLISYRYIVACIVNSYKPLLIDENPNEAMAH